MYLSSSIRQYYGNVVPVHHNAVDSFVNAGSSFLLLIVGQDAISARMESYLISFLGFHKPDLFVLRVDTDADPATAKCLSVVAVPQLRLYIGGTEVNRHRGLINYDKLFDFTGIRRRSQ